MSMNDTIPHDVDDADLYLRYGNGDELSFDVIISRWHGGVYSFFFRLCGNAAEAEDLAQEVFIKLVRGASRYEKTAKFSTFLFRVARNCWLDHIRKQGRRTRTVSIDAVRSEEGQSLQERLDSGSASPLAVLEGRERLAVIQEVIDELSEDHRLVFVLAVEQELKYAEIAEVLDVPEGTVKSRMHTAVLRLRDRLKRRGLAGSVGVAIDRR
ncbi:MAG: RNA polymerase sigma factor [Planctomycetota bacterium]|jgi:RNA polymerase sigma-70 factor (ECF subfamily)